MSDNSALDRYEIVIPVKMEDIDELGHVNNTVYLRWVQEAAIAHWSHFATQEQVENILWVVSHHEIDYKSPARLGDDIISCTWVGAASEITFERHTEIFRAAGRKLLARARTLWIPINSKTKKIIRVSADVRSRFSVQATGD